MKKVVALARAEAYRGLYSSLDAKDGEKEVHRIAKQRDRASRDVQKIRIIKDAEEKPLTREGDILKGWQKYFEEVVNEENDHEKRTDLATGTMREAARVTMEEVRNAMKKMKNGKAVGPDKLPVEAWKCLGEAAVDFLTRLFSKILQSGEMPKEWRYSTLIPIFKSMVDAQCCSNYRGIELMSHSMKMLERVIDRRIRQEVQITIWLYARENYNGCNFCTENDDTGFILNLENLENRQFLGKVRENLE